MEKYAYSYATSKGYSIPTYTNPQTGRVREVMHMSDLFNMTAGTSTGSILAAGLAAPRPDNETDPALFSDELIDIYSTKGDLIFEKQALKSHEVVFWFFVFTGLFGYLFWRLGNYKFDNTEEMEELQELEAKLRGVKAAESGKHWQPSLNDSEKGSSNSYKKMGSKDQMIGALADSLRSRV